MNQPKLEWRVGLFAVIGLALLAALLIQFSKGLSLFAPAYEVLLKTRNVGGIKKGAAVLLAGVPVGSVRSVELTPDGRAVILHLRVLEQYSIHGDARFIIEQAGFLGDQYVTIIPTTNALPVLVPGELKTCEEPFDLQEAARLAAGFLQRIDFTAQKLNDAVVRLDRTLLSEKNLTNLTTAIANFKLLSDQALTTATNLDRLVQANAPNVSTGISNLLEFSERLNATTRELEQILVTNRDQVAAFMKSMDDAATKVNDVLNGLQAGNGVAGSLLKDEPLRNQMSLTVSNLSVVSSNLARFGLLYKPRQPKSGASTPRLIYPPKRF
jgi:phospholipid/cholesterol/gamma-HCH transport system substrate-binding protein